ncbi:MAG: class I SAM-dependent methyltransferase [Candidatus Omnitrophota bacterium]
MEWEILDKCNLCGSGNIYYIDKKNYICRCRNCKYVFDNPRPTLKEIISFYSLDNKYNTWLDEEPQRDSLWKGRLELLIKYNRAGKLLDIGAGFGQFLFFAKEYFNIEGTEISESAIRIAKEKYGIDVTRGELEDICWDCKFDVITMFHILEHVHNPKAVLMKSKKLLNSNGIMVIAVPNDINSLRAIIRRILARTNIKRFGCLGKLGIPRLSNKQDEIHISHFTPSVLQCALESNGFTVLNNSLDRYYVAGGLSRITQDFFYVLCLAILKIFRINLYDTILIYARKNPD